MPAVTTSSGLLAESIAAFSKAAHQAFSEVETQARQDVAQAATDAREARLERDTALEALNAARQEEQKLQREVSNTKATLKQAEISISHQKETISQLRWESTQLRQEAAQWKDQSQIWQDHFLRVEHERCRLNSRIEELAAGRIQWSQTMVDRFTPNQPTADITEPSSLSHTKRSSASSLKQHHTYEPGSAASPLDVDSPSISARRVDPPKSKRHGVIKHSSPLLSPSHESPSPSHKSGIQTLQTHQGPSHHPVRRQTTVIRRVQAVINVKKEELDEELDQAVVHPPHRRTRVRPEKRPAKGEWRQSDESDEDYETSDQSYREDENDELMLGAEESRNEAINSSKEEQSSSLPRKRRKVGSSTGRSKPIARKV